MKQLLIIQPGKRAQLYLLVFGRERRNSVEQAWWNSLVWNNLLRDAGTTEQETSIWKCGCKQISLFFENTECTSIWWRSACGWKSLTLKWLVSGVKIQPRSPHFTAIEFFFWLLLKIKLLETYQTWGLKEAITLDFQEINLVCSLCKTFVSVFRSAYSDMLAGQGILFNGNHFYAIAILTVAMYPSVNKMLRSEFVCTLVPLHIKWI